jgi:hypothetical protein
VEWRREERNGGGATDEAVDGFRSQLGCSVQQQKPEIGEDDEAESGRERGRE